MPTSLSQSSQCVVYFLLTTVFLFLSILPYCTFSSLSCSSVHPRLFLLLLHRLDEVLDVLGHQPGFLHGGKMAATGHGREGHEFTVFLCDPQFGSVHQLVGEAGNPGGDVHWYPVRDDDVLTSDLTLEMLFECCWCTELVLLTASPTFEQVILNCASV